MTTRIGRVTSRPRSRSPTSSSRARVAFSVAPSTSASGCLVPSIEMPSATTHVCSPKWTPSISRQTRSSPDRSAASSSASAVWVMATNRRDTADLSGLDLQPGAHGQRQQALGGRLGDLGQRDRDLLGDGQPKRARLGVPGLVVLAHGGPLPSGVLGGSPETYQTAGLRWGTATSRSTNRGTTSRSIRTG